MARAYVGTVGPAGEPFVARVLRASGQAVELPPSRPWVQGLHRRLKRRSRLVPPEEVRPGDVVFFRNTKDLNGNRRPDDGVTFAGVVEQVGGGRVVFIGQRAGRVRRMALQPRRPELVRDSRDLVVNTRLVRWPGQSKAMTAGQCFVAFGRP